MYEGKLRLASSVKSETLVKPTLVIDLEGEGHFGPKEKSVNYKSVEPTGSGNEVYEGIHANGEGEEGKTFPEQGTLTEAKSGSLVATTETGAAISEGEKLSAAGYDSGSSEDGEGSDIDDESDSKDGPANEAREITEAVVPIRAAEGPLDGEKAMPFGRSVNAPNMLGNLSPLTSGAKLSLGGTKFDPGAATFGDVMYTEPLGGDRKEQVSDFGFLNVHKGLSEGAHRELNERPLAEALSTRTWANVVGGILNHG
ncbi:hypothetical protein U1Q18_037898, partial [Sarracenia purpurea var. burkii]